MREAGAPRTGAVVTLLLEVCAPPGVVMVASLTALRNVQPDNVKAARMRMGDSVGHRISSENAVNAKFVAAP
jgi:hypothetical protein